MSDIIPITSQNFEEHKRRAIKLIEDMNIEDLDPNFEMTIKQGIITGNHANKCDSCNILHYLMAYVINKHRLVVDR